MPGEIDNRMIGDDVEARREAVLRLRHLPGTPVAEFAKLLLKAMKDSSWRVRKTAVEILLKEYSIESYIDNLVKLLYVEDNAGARTSAIEALTRLGKKATSYLMEAFKTPNEDVRKFIIDIIGEINDKKALPLIIEALKDEDDNVRASAVENLGNLKEPSVVEALLEILESGDLWTAYPAAEALGKIGDVRAVPSLINVLENAPLREPALRALGRLAHEDSLEHIVPFISDRSKAVQNEALCALEMIYRRGMSEGSIIGSLKVRFGDGVTDILLEHSHSSRADVKMSAILFLGLLKDERALGPLLDMGLEEEFSEGVKRALVYIGREKPEALLPLFDKKDPILLRFLCSVVSEVASPIYFDTLKGLLSDEDGHIRGYAAVGLSRIGKYEAIDMIKALLIDPYPDVQEEAVKALGSLKDGLKIGEVINSFKSENLVLRRNIILLLGEIAIPEALPTIGLAMKDGSVLVRKAAVTALSKNKTKDAVGYLTMALTDEDPSVRVLAALTLGNIGDPASYDSLSLLIMDSDDLVRVSAIKAIGMLGDKKAVGRLIEVFSDANGFVVATAMEAVAKLGGEDARKALAEMLFSRDKEIRRTAIRGLSGFENIGHVILPFLRDKDWATRVAAIESLRRHRSEKVDAEMEKLFDEEDDPIVRKSLEKFFK